MKKHNRIITKNHITIAALLGLLVSCVTFVRADENKPVTPALAISPLQIAIMPQDGFNLKIDDQINDHYVVVKLISPAQNWFAGEYINLPTDKEIIIGLSMAGNDTEGNKADVSKWVGLKPVMTYGDPSKYETYEWYKKDAQGRWMSGDPLKSDIEKFAGTGKFPKQTAIPQKQCQQCLSSDNCYWQPWSEVDAAEAVPTLNIFRIKQKLTLPTATVAMRIPFTYTYLQCLLDHLRAVNIPGVNIDDLLTTHQQRHLQVIRLDALKMQDGKPQRTVLVIAREHATEPTSSWVLSGLLGRLCDGSPTAQQLRQNTTWLLVPIVDPDGSANSQFDRMIDKFGSSNDPTTPPEVFAYARYLADYVNTGNTIDIAITLHNVECNECKNVYCPFIDCTSQDTVRSFNDSLFESLRDNGFQVDIPYTPWDVGRMSCRLAGWTNFHFSSLDLGFETNDRMPVHRLSLDQMQRIGLIFANYIDEWLYNKAGNDWHQKVLEALAKREKERSVYYKRMYRAASKRTPTEILALGY